MNEEINQQEEFESKTLSEKISYVKQYIFESYKLLEQVDVKGHQNSKTLNAVFDGLYNSTIMLNVSLEEAMNFEGKEKQEKKKEIKKDDK